MNHCAKLQNNFKMIDLAPLHPTLPPQTPTSETSSIVSLIRVVRLKTEQKTPFVSRGGQEKSHGHDDGGGGCPEALFWKNSVRKMEKFHSHSLQFLLLKR